MQEDLYDSQPSEPQDNSEQSGDENPNEEGRETALIPSSLCPGMKPGEEVVLKIEAVHDDQYAVSYAPKEKTYEGKEGGDDGGMDQAPMPGAMASAGGGDPNYS